MANENKNQKNTVPAPPPQVKVSSMPDQFFPKADKHGFPLVMVGVLAFIFLGLVAGAVVIFTRTVNPPEPISQANTNFAPPVNLPPANLNLEVNTNVNVNENLNAGLNTNIPVNVPVVPPTPRTLLSTQDTDNDKLTDLEESVYNTDPKRPDTDGDGHLDGPEATNLFDPLKPAPSMLEGSGTAIIYPNEAWAYNVTYPSKWVARSSDASGREVTFTSDIGEYVEILVQDNPEKLPVAEWYARQSTGILASQLETFTTKRGMRGVKSFDGLTVYLAPDQPDAGTTIYVITYNAGVATAFNYLSTWQMMINSFNVTRVISEGAAQPSVPAAPAPSTPAVNQNSNQNVNTQVNVGG